jgi:hypothetical protein
VIQNIKDRNDIVNTTIAGILCFLKEYMQRKFDVITKNEESFQHMTREVRKTIPMEAVTALDKPITMYGGPKERSFTSIPLKYIHLIISHYGKLTGPFLEIKPPWLGTRPGDVSFPLL